MQEGYDPVTSTSKESAQADQDKRMNIANNQELDVSNIRKSSSLEVYKTSDSVETPIYSNNKKREVDKINKIPDRKTREKKKSTLILGDSIVKNIEGWRLNRHLKFSVSVKAISVATTNGMSHHVKGCLIDCSPEVILHHGTNDLSRNASADDIASKTVALAKIYQSRIQPSLHIGVDSEK